MKRAIVHMGMPKTATTSFQNAVYEHRHTLFDRHRILYPAVGANHTNTLCPMFLPDPRSHISVKMMGITTPEQAERFVSNCFEKMEAELSIGGWDTLVLSAEGLANLHTGALRDLRSWLDGFVDEIEVIYWLRHPVSFTVSVIQQMLKGGETIDDMIDRMLPLSNYQRRLENAIAAFGAEAMRIYRFEDCIQHPNGPVGAFCEQIYVPWETANTIIDSATVENESMSMLCGYTLDALNRLVPMFKDGVFNPLRQNGELAKLLTIKGPRFALDYENTRRIREASRPEIAWLRDKCGLDFYPDMLVDEFAHPESVQIPDRETTESLALLLSDLHNSKK
ncbi:hypothetical protein ACHFJ0_08265 [Paracoccus sp. NGMCC 1.201697]|uniref:Sulfotransferase family protein n=1 Tax=Paracoccus broussonetiae subsp. drimophilus TaxID=3373869 RepID=A0ABW7LIT1_9RHOB